MKESARNEQDSSLINRRIDAGWSAAEWAYSQISTEFIHEAPHKGWNVQINPQRAVVEGGESKHCCNPGQAIPNLIIVKEQRNGSISIHARGGDQPVSISLSADSFMIK